MTPRRLVFVPLFALAAILCGCTSQAEQQADQAVTAYSLGNFQECHRLLLPLCKNPDENFVLNNARLGSTALVEHDYATAQMAFMRAYEVMNSVGVNNGGRSLGAALVDEKIKIWKGEPFDRAMVSFYLGMLYYMQHDYGNARAAFENSLFKLRDYGPGDNKGDKYAEVESGFTLGYLMLAKSWQHLNDSDKAQHMFDRVAQLQPADAPLANAQLNLNSNLLLLVESGTGPQKIQDDDGSLVGYGPRPGAAGVIYSPRVNVDGTWIDSGPTPPTVDLLSLAQDRRWQSIDTIRVTKSIVGTGMIAGGAYALTQRRQEDAEIGLGLIAAGLLLKATSQADMREWEMLPRTVFVIPLHLTPGPHQITVNFPDGTRQTWQNLVAAEEGDEETYYMKMMRWNPGPFSLPATQPAR